MATVTVRIGRDGTFKVGVKGKRGPGCKALTAELERALGVSTDVEHTAEYNQPPVQQEVKQVAG